MKKEFLIKSLNMLAAEALTLEKAEDRVEFQAMLFIDSDTFTNKDCAENWDVCPKHVNCPSDVPPANPPVEVPCPEMK